MGDFYLSRFPFVWIAQTHIFLGSILLLHYRWQRREKEAGFCSLTLGTEQRHKEQQCPWDPFMEWGAPPLLHLACAFKLQCYFIARVTTLRKIRKLTWLVFFGMCASVASFSFQNTILAFISRRVQFENREQSELTILFCVIEIKLLVSLASLALYRLLIFMRFLFLTWRHE